MGKKMSKWMEKDVMMKKMMTVDTNRNQKHLRKKRRK
jgi:hypothetical protein